MNFDGVWWLRDGADTSDEMKTNIPHRVKHHSPTGMNVGYGGSGPADFALNIIQYRLEQLGYNGRRTSDTWNKEWMFRDVWNIYQKFKHDFIVGGDQLQGNISWEAVDDWLKHRSEDQNIRLFMRKLPYTEHHICKPEMMEASGESVHLLNELPLYPLFMCTECFEYHIKKDDKFIPLAILDA